MCHRAAVLVLLAPSSDRRFERKPPPRGRGGSRSWISTGDQGKQAAYAGQSSMQLWAARISVMQFAKTQVRSAPGGFVERSTQPFIIAQVSAGPPTRQTMTSFGQASALAMRQSWQSGSLMSADEQAAEEEPPAPPVPCEPPLPPAPPSPPLPPAPAVPPSPPLPPAPPSPPLPPAPAVPPVPPVCELPPSPPLPPGEASSSLQATAAKPRIEERVMTRRSRGRVIANLSWRESAGTSWYGG